MIVLQEIVALQRSGEGAIVIFDLAANRARALVVDIDAGHDILAIARAVGGLEGEAALRVSGRRRGRYTDIIGTAGAGVGTSCCSNNAGIANKGKSNNAEILLTADLLRGRSGLTTT